MRMEQLTKCGAMEINIHAHELTDRDKPQIHAYKLLDPTREAKTQIPANELMDRRTSKFARPRRCTRPRDAKSKFMRTS